MVEPLTLAAQITINGILFGSIYSMVALGLNLIFGTMKIVFLAQGTITILGAYTAFWLFNLFGVDPFISMLVIFPLFFVLGIASYYGIFHRALKIGPNPTLLASFGLLIIVQTAMAVAWTANPRGIYPSYASLVFSLGDVHVPFIRIIALVFCVVVTAVLLVVLKKTMLGKAIRATSEDPEAASLMGINVSKINCIAFSIGIILAGLAGLILGTIYSFDPYLGLLLTLKGFVALTIGGLGSTVGALVGGLILGVIESTTAFLVGAGWSDFASYTAFLVILLIKPYGIFGKKW